MYVGIYQVGPQQRSLSGKQIEELAHLSGTTPEEYIADAGILQVKMPAYGAMVLHHRARDKYK
jgi:hypothetical protein